MEKASVGKDVAANPSHQQFLHCLSLSDLHKPPSEDSFSDLSKAFNRSLHPVCASVRDSILANVTEKKRKILSEQVSVARAGERVAQRSNAVENVLGKASLEEQIEVGHGPWLKCSHRLKLHLKYCWFSLRLFYTDIS